MRRERDSETDGAALAGYAFDADMTAVGFNSELAKRQAQTGTHEAPTLPGFDLTELFKDTVEGFGGDSFAGIADSKHDK
jgi:hypothetical protein